MKNKLFYFMILLLCYIVPSVACQFFSSGTIEPGVLVSLAVGLAAAVFLFAGRSKEQIALGFGKLLAVFSAPIVLLVLAYLPLSLFSIQLTGWFFLGIYIAGVLIILFFITRSSTKDVSQNPVMDERSLQHFAWSGSWSFLFLNFLIIGALIQPWVALDQLALWVGVLIAGLIFWLTIWFVLETKN